MKNFDLWNQEKKLIENVNSQKIKCHRRQIWLCKIGQNLGTEISKNAPHIRPVLILESYFGGDLILVLPLTSQFNQNYARFLFKIDGKDYGLLKDSYLVLNQIRVISKKRLLKNVRSKKTKKYVAFSKSDF